MKVKILKNYFLGELEESINKFIKIVKVIDIKFCADDDFGYAMIMYEEKR